MAACQSAPRDLLQERSGPRANCKRSLAADLLNNHSAHTHTVRGRLRPTHSPTPPQIAPFFIIFFSIALTVNPANADYQFALDAYQHSDYNTALKEWLSVANSPQGTVPPAIQAETLYAIAMLYWTGQGVEQDTQVAASWLHRAAGINCGSAGSKWSRG